MNWLIKSREKLFWIGRNWILLLIAFYKWLRKLYFLYHSNNYK